MILFCETFSNSENETQMKEIENILLSSYIYYKENLRIFSPNQTIFLLSAKIVTTQPFHESLENINI